MTLRVGVSCSIWNVVSSRPIEGGKGWEVRQAQVFYTLLESTVRDGRKRTTPPFCSQSGGPEVGRAIFRSRIRGCAVAPVATRPDRSMRSMSLWVMGTVLAKR